ncbi:hypothetical protein [uncultured Sphaerochaeta sp.]|uniref:hypothetical protein n=1 Tax=uncultured Sphaerochaeta sp. TaxID=886478 RepID=UPI002A0A976A|nr:hypothetical protein [uncultured Sphaerochaeta sp.]
MLKITKKKIDTIEKCYCVAPLLWQDTFHFLAAGEKAGPCRVFDAQGKIEETLWMEPGGVMSMAQIPGSDGCFITTQKMFSPNDSKEAYIAYAHPTPSGWQRNVLVNLPHVHRFDVYDFKGIHYLIACTLKSCHAFEDDWTSAGKVYAAILPEDLTVFDEEHQLPLEVIKDGLFHNHGYYRTAKDNGPASLISADNGVFLFAPPLAKGEKWRIEQLLDIPVSDATLVDFDGDGNKELAIIAPFHGDTLAVYKPIKGKYTQIWTAKEKLEFLHPLFGGNICGKPSLVCGYRKGKRELFLLQIIDGVYTMTVFDSNCGPANVIHFMQEDKDVIISANRETDELAYYTFEEVQ